MRSVQVLRQDFPAHQPTDGPWLSYVRDNAIRLSATMVDNARIVGIAIVADDDRKPYRLEVSVEDGIAQP